MKKITMTLMLLFTMIGSTFAQNGNAVSSQEFERGLFNHVAVNAGLGLEGFSIGVAAPINDYFEVEAGANFMPGVDIKDKLYVSNIEIADGVYTPNNTRVRVKASFARTTIQLKGFVYPFGGNSKFFVAGGFSLGGKKLLKVTGYSDDLKQFAAQYPQYKDEILRKVSADLGGYDLSLKDDFTLDADIRSNAIRPYLGLGFGRAVPKHRFGCRFEMGCQFLGSLKVYQNGHKLDLDKVKEDNADDDISDIVKNWTIYPCLKLSIVGRIL